MTITKIIKVDNMFKSKNTRVELDTIFINEHTLENFNGRKTKQKVDFSLPDEFVITLLIQRSKNNQDIKMNKLRGAIRLKNNLYLIVNIYNVKKGFKDEGKIVAKALTVLTKKQLSKGSTNFPNGNHINKGFIVKRPKLVYKDVYIGSDKYEDYLDKIEWTEYDVNIV